jgi:hypothetical protein
MFSARYLPFLASEMRYTATNLLPPPPYCAIVGPIDPLCDSRNSETFYKPHTHSSRACRRPNRSARLVPCSHLSPRTSSLSQKTTYMGRGRVIKEIRSTQSADYPTLYPAPIFTSVEFPGVCHPVPLWLVGGGFMDERKR